MWKKTHIELEFLGLEFYHFLSQHLFFFLFFIFSSQIVLYSSSSHVLPFLQPNHLPLLQIVFPFLCSSSDLHFLDRLSSFIFFETPNRFPLPMFFFGSAFSRLSFFFLCLLHIWFFFFWFLQIYFYKTRV